MGERAVRLSITLSVDDNRKITERAWNELEDEIDRFVDRVQSKTIFAAPAVVEATYSRDVETREPFSYSLTDDD